MWICYLRYALNTVIITLLTFPILDYWHVNSIANFSYRPIKWNESYSIWINKPKYVQFLLNWWNSWWSSEVLQILFSQCHLHQLELDSVDFHLFYWRTKEQAVILELLQQLKMICKKHLYRQHHDFLCECWDFKLAYLAFLPRWNTQSTAEG